MDDTARIDRPSTASRRARWTVITLPCLVFLLACSLCLNETMLYSPDSANYLGWAQALSHFQGFRNGMGPEPERYVFNAPLYPVLLAPLSLAFPLSIPAAKIATLLAGLLTLAAFQVFLLRRLPAGAVLGAGMLLALNPLFILYSTQVLSDIPFAACCVIVVSLLEHLAAPGREEPRGTFLLIGALCGALFLREVGAALVLASACLLLVRGRTRVLLLLLIAVSLTYGLWYIRNEIIVARAENPGLRNMSLIFSHVYTETGASAAAEIGARLARSAEFYGPALLSLITHPFDAAWTYSVTDSTDGMLASVQAILGAARWPLALVSGIPVALGAARIVRRGVFGPFLAALLPAYGAIIVLYPVSDVRFIFPLLLLLLWCAAEGIVLPLERLKGGGRRAGIAAVSALVCLMALPNMAWVRNVVCTNAAFRKDPGEFVASHARSDPYPNELMLIPRRAAAWIAANSPPETVVGSKIKSAAVWLDGRPLVVLNPLLPVEEFDNRIRDYGIRYLVCELQAHQIPDFSLQMALSTRHTFQGEFAFGDIRVYHVREKADPREPSVVPPPEGFGAAEALYLQGVSALAYGDQKRAAATFEALERVPGVETTALFYAAVAHEFTMNLDTAEALFARFRTIPQSAVYLRQAQVHEFIIALLRSASQDPPGEEKASKYQEAAMSYWMLGFRVQAVRMLREALRLEPGYFAGNVFGALFSLSGGDTSGARKGVALAERAKPADPLTRSLKLILACIDSLPRAADRGKLEVAIGREYAAMGLYEMGIDQAMKALREGEDPDALRLLADLYIKKERHGPALSALLRLQKLSPGDPAAAAEIRQLAALLK